MTLTQAVEEAREALKDAVNYVGDKYYDEYNPSLAGRCKQALAALPDNPMTEEEIIGKVSDILAAQDVGYDAEDFVKNKTSWNSVSKEIIRALKAANALYIEEK